MSNNYSYRVIIERLRQFADGHFLIQKFYHGEVAEADLWKEPKYPMMHVLPVTITPSEQTLEYDFEIRFADIGRDKETKQEYQKEIISDCARLALDLVAEIQNGGILFGREVEVVGKTATIQPFIEEFTHVLTGVQLNLQISVPYNWSACDIPADYSPNIISNPEVNGGVVTKIGIYSNGALVGYTSYLDFGDDFEVTIDGSQINIEYVGTTGALTCENIDDCSVIININESIVSLNERVTDLEEASALYVPYTGATQYVNLGDNGLIADSVEFDITPTVQAGEARMVWNDEDGTLEFGLKGGSVTLQIGQEEVVRVVNGTGTTLEEGNYQAVKITGAQGQRLQVLLAQADNDANSATTIGIVTETIEKNQEGFITTNGLVRKINTTGSLQGETWNDGDILYLSPTTAGQITNIKPSAPDHTIIIGFVVYAHSNNGKIFVKVDNGYELEELHNVAISSARDGQYLRYKSSNGTWFNTSVFNYSVNFKDVVQHEVILPYDWKIISIGSNPSSVSVTIELNGSAYTLGDTIAANTDVITIDTDAVGFINLICDTI